MTQLQRALFFLMFAIGKLNSFFQYLFQSGYILNCVILAHFGSNIFNCILCYSLNGAMTVGTVQLYHTNSHET